MRFLPVLAADLRFALRMARQNLAFSSVAIVCLALGIGASSAMSSLIYALWVDPYPYRDSNRLLNLSFVSQEGRMRHVIVTRDSRIFGVVRVNTGIRRGLAKIDTGITLGDVARPNFTIVREDDIAFEVIQRIWRKRAVMAIVVRGRGVPRPQNIAGVITKEHVADSVASSVQIYPS